MPLTAPTRPRFVVDAHLGRLARYLRMLGFDAIYGNDPGDPLLLSLAETDERILLTRDQRLKERAPIDRALLVKSTGTDERLEEVIRAFDLMPEAAPFTRCMRCNTPLEEIDKSEVIDRLPPRTAEHFDWFAYCPSCDKVYWKGSHFDRMNAFIDRLSTESA